MELLLWKHSTLKVFVYRNLQRKCWSVKALNGENRGRVILYASSVDLSPATFKVNEAGRQRVLKEQQKNVHAGVEGWLLMAHVIKERYPSYPKQRETTNDTGWDGVNDDGYVWREVTYDPYKYGSFVHTDDLSPVIDQHEVVLDNDMKVRSMNLQVVPSLVQSYQNQGW